MTKRWLRGWLALAVLVGVCGCSSSTSDDAGDACKRAVGEYLADLWPAPEPSFSDVEVSGDEPDLSVTGVVDYTNGYDDRQGDPFSCDVHHNRETDDVDVTSYRIKPDVVTRLRSR